MIVRMIPVMLLFYCLFCFFLIQNLLMKPYW